MKLDAEEAKVIEEMVSRIAKSCGVTYKEDQNCIYVRSGDWQVRLVISEIETPSALNARIRAYDEQEARMEELKARLKKLGVNIEAELYRVENGCLPQ